MKVILWMATSVNGMIAGEDGNEDFLSDKNWTEFSIFANQKKALIWGRTTFEAVKKWDKKYLDSLSTVTKVIVSSDSQYQPGFGAISAVSAEDALEKLNKLGFEEVVLTGGAHTNSSFAKKGYIDELVVDVQSVVIGKGKALFASEDFELNLELIDTKIVDDKNIIQLHYKVVK